MANYQLRGLFAGFILGGLLWQTPVYATLEDTLHVLPAAPAMSVSLDLNPKSWPLLAQIPWQQSEPWQQLAATSKKNGIDLEKELLPLLGSHVSFAVYPVKDQEPILMAALHVTDPAKVTALLNQIFKSKGSTWTIALPAFPIHLRLQGSTLIVDTAPKGWSAPAKNLWQDTAFKNIYQRFQQEPLWAFLSADEFPKLAPFFGKEDNLVATLQSLMGGIANLDEGYGMSFALHGNGLTLKSGTQFKPESQRTPAQQALLNKLQQASGQTLTDMLALMPEKPVLLMAYPDLQHWGDVIQQNAPGDEELQDLMKDMTEGIAKLTQLNWEKDLLPLLDGRIGLAVNYPQTQPDLVKNPMPQVLLYLGVKDPARFRDLMLNQFAVNAASLTDDDFLGPLLDQTRAKGSAVKANMHTLQTMVETYAVDWGGEYPPNLAGLYTEALSKEGSQYRYWKDLTNPVTQQQGFGKKKALMDYSQYKWFKAHPDFDGMVFYEPIKNAGLMIGYVIYGYLDGKEYKLGQEVGMSETIRPDAPRRSTQAPLKFVPRGMAGTHPLYRLNLPASATTQQLGLAPTMVLSGNMAIISLQAQAIIDALEHQHQNSGLLKDPQFIAARQQLFGQKGVGLTYLDLKRVGQLVLPLVEKELTGNERAKAMISLLQAFRYLAFDMKYSDQGVDNLLNLNVNWSDVDFKWLVSIPGEMQTVQNHAKMSSVKANMHTVQTMVETYAVDWGGVYPSTLEQLHQEARKQDYWKDLTNPFSNERGMEQVMADYAKYKPGTGQAGLVFYEPVKEKSKSVTLYRIYGGDSQGELLLQSPPETGVKGNIANVKANMHTLQTIVETYAVDWGGVYPPNMEALYQEAIRPGLNYWKAVANPFIPMTQQTPRPPKPKLFVLTNGAGESDLNWEKGNGYMDFKWYHSSPDDAGLALYVPDTQYHHITKYWIYGCDQNGELIRDQKSKALFYLTNG